MLCSQAARDEEVEAQAQAEAEALAQAEAQANPKGASDDGRLDSEDESSSVNSVEEDEDGNCVNSGNASKRSEGRFVVLVLQVLQARRTAPTRNSATAL